MKYREEKKPKKVSRLKQCNKANRLLRRFYSGRKPVAQVVNERVLAHGEVVY